MATFLVEAFAAVLAARVNAAMRSYTFRQVGKLVVLLCLDNYFAGSVTRVDIHLAVGRLAKRQLAVDPVDVLQHHATDVPGLAVVVAVNQPAFGAAFIHSGLEDTGADDEPARVWAALELDAMIVIERAAAVPSVGIRLRHDLDRRGPAFAVVGALHDRETSALRQPFFREPTRVLGLWK